MDLTKIFKRKKDLEIPSDTEGDNVLEQRLDEMKKQFSFHYSSRELVNGYMQSVDSKED